MEYRPHHYAAGLDDSEYYTPPGFVEEDLKGTEVPLKRTNAVKRKAKAKARVLLETDGPTEQGTQTLNQTIRPDERGVPRNRRWGTLVVPGYPRVPVPLKAKEIAPDLVVETPARLQDRWILIKNRFRGVGLYVRPRTKVEKLFRKLYDELFKLAGHRVSCLPKLREHPADALRRQGLTSTRGDGQRKKVWHLVSILRKNWRALARPVLEHPSS